MEARLDFLASNSVNRRPALKRPPPQIWLPLRFLLPISLA